MSAFKKAQRKKAKLRLGLDGPSGSGKTYSALLIAKGLSLESNIAVIDTENGSASLYSHLADFDVADLTPPFTPESYIELIQEAAKHYDVLIIDSISHEWSGKGGILEIHDNMPGNSFQNWARVTPRHNRFMEAMLHAPCHVIATMRSKEQYILQENNQGKQEPKKAGMKEQQRDGVIYEFTTVLTLDVSNQATRNKDRTGLFQHNVWFVPTEDTGKTFKEWLESGAEPENEPQRPTQTAPSNNTSSAPEGNNTKPDSGAQHVNYISTQQQKELAGLLKEVGCKNTQQIVARVNAWLENKGHETVSYPNELTSDQAAGLIDDLNHEVADLHAAQEG